jgi:hypothetical protein
MLGLLDEIKTASEIRHDLIHGFIVEQSGGHAKTIRIVHTKEKSFGKRQLDITTNEIMKAAVAANKLAGRSLNFGTGLQNLVETLLKETDKTVG